MGRKTNKNSRSVEILGGWMGANKIQKERHKSEDESSESKRKLNEGRMTWRKEREELDDFMEWCWICDCSFQHLYNKSERPNTRIMFISVSSIACIRNGRIPWHDGSMNEELVPVSWRCITLDLCSAVICVIYSALTFSPQIETGWLVERMIPSYAMYRRNPVL